MEACLKALQTGNTCVVWKLDRLGRNLKHLVPTVEELHDRGINLRVFAGAGAETDTTTANGRLVFGIFGVDFEREHDRRTHPRRPGGGGRQRTPGRQPRKMDAARLHLAMHAMADRNTLVHDLTKRLGITTTTLYMYVNGDGTVKAPGQKLLDAVKDASARTPAFHAHKSLCRALTDQLQLRCLR